MKTTDFVLDLIGSGFFVGAYNFVENFLPTVLQSWLERNSWIEDDSSPCKYCAKLEAKLEGKFSEQICQQNVLHGGSCYRETLRKVFIPFVQTALAEEGLSIRELGRVVHRQCAVHDGIGQKTLFRLICDELGGEAEKLHSSGQLTRKKLSQADIEYLAKVGPFFKQRFR